MTTIRALMLAQQARHPKVGYRWTNNVEYACPACDLPWPCVERVAADAVIATLDARDAEIRMHLEEAKYHAYTSDRRVTEHIEAALALLTPDEQEDA